MMIAVVSGGVSWFPQEYAALYFSVKGVLALCATLLLVTHMNLAWSELMSPGRRLRYMALLYFAVLLTVSTVAQERAHAVVAYTNLGAGVGVIILNVAAIVSLHETSRSRRMRR